MKDYVYRIDEPDPKLVKLRCKHAKEWPPAEDFLDGHPERLRRDGVIDDHVYEANKVWRRECGKRQIDNKCSDCPHSRVKVRVKSRGRGRIRTVEVGFVDFMKQKRADAELILEKQS